MTATQVNVTCGLVIAILVGAVVAGWIASKEDMRAEAIAAGVAHYTVNPTNGETKFEWKTCK